MRDSDAVNFMVWVVSAIGIFGVGRWIVEQFRTFDSTLTDDDRNDQ